MTCDKCGCEFALKDLKRTNGRCPKCGDVLPVTKYCPFVPEEHVWKLYSNAPLSIRIYCALWGGFLLSMIGSVVGFVDILAEADLAPETGFSVLSLIVGCLLVYGATVDARELVFGAPVRGKWLFPAIVTLLPTVGFALLRHGRGLSLAFALFAAVVSLIPLISSSARNWRRKCKEEERAYQIARESGSDLSDVRDHGYKCRPLAIAVALVVLGFGAFDGTRRMVKDGGVDLRVEQSLDKMEATWRESGTAAFLADPMRYLAATNDVSATLKMLDQGVETVNETFDDLWCVFAFARKSSMVAACRKVVVAHALLFSYATVIVSQYDQLNRGDPEGVLRQTFGTEEMKTIGKILDAERNVCLERSTEILEFWKFWTSRHTQTGDDSDKGNR